MRALAAVVLVVAVVACGGGDGAAAVTAAREACSPERDGLSDIESLKRASESAARAARLDPVWNGLLESFVVIITAADLAMERDATTTRAAHDAAQDRLDRMRDDVEAATRRLTAECMKARS